MRITKIETIRLEEHSKILWVQVHTDDGRIGLGETTYGARTVESAIHELFASMLIGADPTHVDRHWNNMFRLADHWGYGGAEMRAISALDIALWDLIGQAADRPMYEVLGGACRDRIRVYNTGCGPDYATDPLPYAKDLMTNGITAVKVNAYPAKHAGNGFDLQPSEVERIVAPIRILTESFGDSLQIAVDGHGFWSLPGAIALAKALEPFPIMWLEELLSPRNVAAHARLARATSLPVCVSERLMTRFQFQGFLQAGAADIVMPDLVWTGGVSETKRIAELADTHQLPVAPHDCTGPVNLFACAHICMNAPNAMIMETLREFYQGWYTEIVTPEIPIENGWLLAPTGPGLGARLRPEIWRRPDITVQVTDAPAEHYLGFEI